MTPVLVLAFGFSPTVAVGTDLLHGAVFKTVGAVRHRTLGTVQARLGGWMFVGSAPTSLAGVAVAAWLRHATERLPDRALRLTLGVVLLASGERMLGAPVAALAALPGVVLLGIRVHQLLCQQPLSPPVP